MITFRDKLRALIIPACTLVAFDVLISIGAEAQMSLQRPTPAIDPVETVAKPSVPMEQRTSSPPALAGKQRPLQQIRVAPRLPEGSGIVSNKLDLLDPDAIGLISEAKGGFPLAMWEGTAWSLVKMLLPRIPAESMSAVLRDLARRLLTTRAGVPAKKPVAASLLALRVERLLAMGAVEDALALIEITKGARRDKNLARTRVEALFYTNDNAGACRAVNKAAQNYKDLYWLQATAFCRALSNDHDQAALIADVILERQEEVERVFFVAVDALAGATSEEVPPLKSPAALHLAMMRAANIQIPPDFVRNASAAALRVVASAPNAALETRLFAAEKARLSGALPADKLVSLYLSIDFTADEVTRPFWNAEENWGPRRRALIHRALAAERVPRAKVDLLRRAWQLGSERKSHAAFVDISAAIVATIKPSPELNGFAIEAARTLFSGGRSDEALAWYALVSSDDNNTDPAQNAERMLWHLAVLADEKDAVSLTSEQLKEWHKRHQMTGDLGSLRKSMAFFALLGAIGKEVSPELWHSLLEQPMTTGPVNKQLNLAWRRNLSSATRSARIGEAILFLIVGGGEMGFVGFSLSDAVYVISILRELGLDRDARLMAIETAIAFGL
ncbi:MAG: hypothetical protein VYA17_06710 [Pseudomonadota bacterium]|nr:hypothetical protein [Pseudomonadota bacterium]